MQFSFAATFLLTTLARGALGHGPDQDKATTEEHLRRQIELEEEEDGVPLLSHVMIEGSSHDAVDVVPEGGTSKSGVGEGFGRRTLRAHLRNGDADLHNHWVIRIDNSHEDDGRYGGTSDSVTFRIKDTRPATLGWTHRDGIPCCQTSNYHDRNRRAVNGDIEWVEIEIHGDNALYIDRFWARTNDRSPHEYSHRWGSNNGGVWCLSTDRSDRGVGGSNCYRKIRCRPGSQSCSFWY